MAPLPIVQSDPSVSTSNRDPRENQSLAWVVHLVRIALLIALLVGLHRHVTEARSERLTVGLVETLRRHPDLFPSVTAWRPDRQFDGVVRGVDESNQPLVLVASSSPVADHVIGYAGPTQLLFCMDEDLVLKQVKVLESFDTREHLAKVQRDPEFWNQFKGVRWGERELPHFDGVSGATLTSLAIAEAVATCVHTADSKATIGLRQSLKFPNELTPAELNAWIATTYPSIAESESVDEFGRLNIPVDPKLIAIRTGRLTDEIIGYQGPTEMLWIMDQSRLIDVRLRSSFDNEPYVGYVKQERSFWKNFKGRPLTELATLDREAELIDGVSGATMTSIAVADTVRQAASKWLELESQIAQEMATPSASTSIGATRDQRWNFSINEIMTALLAIVAILWSSSSLRGHQRARPVWQLISFVVLALLSGNLLSLALATGWTSGGPSYRLAPGLTVLVVVSLWMAAIHKRNVYCDHLCPHGILQQWIRPRSNKNRSSLFKVLSNGMRHRWVIGGLSCIAWASIGAGVWSLLTTTPVQVAWLEPFDAYLIGFGFSISGLVWLLSVGASTIQPMMYCRHACPTGKILGYIRRSRSSGTLLFPDAVVFLLCGWIWLS